MPVGDSKTCTKCGATKPLNAFYKQKDCKDGRRPECKDCVKVIRIQHRAANPDLYREHERNRYEKHGDKLRDKARTWYATHTEVGKESRRAHYYANRDRYAAYSAKRKAMKRGVERQFYTRREIYDRDGGHCKLCGTSLPFEPNGFEIDHIVPFDLGGVDTPANVQLACRPCNRSKWANLEGQIHLPV